MTAMNTKTKQMIKIAVLLLASGFFLFQGFALLFSGPEKTKTEQVSTVK